MITSSASAISGAFAEGQKKVPFTILVLTGLSQ